MQTSDRRTFLQRSLATLGLASLSGAAWARRVAAEPETLPARRPIVVSTWSHGSAANRAAWEVLSGGGRALDAVEEGVAVSEADPRVESVGYGGLPDRDGKVTLDASIMNEFGDCGSVAFLQHIMHPTAVARRVMERTPHVMLVGEGALEFALTQGFAKQDLLTPSSRAAWERWKLANGVLPASDARQHDTIGMLALDAEQRLSGACTTSGLAFKMHGRVGDSPIIGAALFVDPQVGAACATGLGEAVIRTVGSFLVVESMRRGASPEEACREAVARIAQRHPRDSDIQVGYLALDRQGQAGACSLKGGFQYAVRDASGESLLDAPSWY